MFIFLCSGELEHEHASDRGRAQVGSGRHGEEESKGGSFLQTLKTHRVQRERFIAPLWPCYCIVTASKPESHEHNKELLDLYPKISTSLQQRFDKNYS